MSHIRIDLPNTNNKWVGFGLANIDTFIIRVGFESANVDTIHILTRHEHDPSTRIVSPNEIYSQDTQPQHSTLQTRPTSMLNSTMGKSLHVALSHDLLFMKLRRGMRTAKHRSNQMREEFAYFGCGCSHSRW